MMSLVLTVPPVAFALGAVLALVQLRGIAEATADLQIELHRLSEVQLAVAETRSATAEARALARSPRRA
jgi:hypothetical protein